MLILYEEISQMVNNYTFNPQLNKMNKATQATISGSV